MTEQPQSDADDLVAADLFVDAQVAPGDPSTGASAFFDHLKQSF